jgi:hypothetical protein
MLKVSATMDASKLRFRRTDGRNHDTLAVLMALFDSNGKYLDGIRKVFEFHMDDQTLAVAVDSGIEARKNFDVKPGTYLLRFVARDSGGPVVAQHSTRVDGVW